MGMFDNLKCETKLPDNSPTKNRLFQTKSFDNTMSTYVITAKGHLYEESWKYRWVDDDNHFLKGYLATIPDSFTMRHLTDYHGDIIFYDSKPMKEDRVWRDYYARFTDGRLSRMWYEDKQY